MAERLIQHYRHDGVLTRIEAALRKAGHDPLRLRPELIAGVDEYHLGGRTATLELIEALDLPRRAKVLDVGSGIGGAARVMAEVGGFDVVGLDVVPDWVEVATVLTERCGLADQVRFVSGDACSLPFEDARFDGATVIHVGMNVSDKAAFAHELARVVRPSSDGDGGRLIVYDIMRVGPGTLEFPLPWASHAEDSAVASPDTYREALTAAGFVHVATVDRTVLALEAAARPLPSPNLTDLMGPGLPELVGRLLGAVRAGILAPVLIEAERR